MLAYDYSKVGLAISQDLITAPVLPSYNL